MLAAQERSASSRFRRPGELFWVLPAVAVIAIATALAVDWAGRVIFDEGRPLVGTLMLLGVAVASSACRCACSPDSASASR